MITRRPGTRARRSAERRRVGERTGELLPDAAVRVLRESGGLGQLAKPTPVGPDREDLVERATSAGRTELEGIQRGAEDDRPRHRILGDGSKDTVAYAEREVAPRDRHATSRVELRDLSRPAPVNADGEQLAVPVGIHSHRIRGGQEDRPLS